MLQTAEWNASHVVRSNTKPEILTRAGRIIEPVKLDKKRSAPDTVAPVATVTAPSDKHKKTKFSTNGQKKKIQ